MKISLHVFAGAGYGYGLEWEASDTITSPRHSMSFRDSIRITIDSLVTLIALPSLVLSLPIEPLKSTNQAYKELGMYLQDIIDTGRHHHHTSPGSTIISQLIAPSDQLKVRPLNDEEIMGNCFIFLTAGFESRYLPLYWSLMRVRTLYFTRFIY